MAVNGNFVIDAVTHAFDLRPENERVPYARQINEANFGFQWQWMPDPYRIPASQYFQAFDADTVAHALFVESGTDVAFYHAIPALGVRHDLSPLAVGREIQERWPGRMYLYGAVSPQVGPEALDIVEEQAEAWGIKGVKCYPVDFIDGKMSSWSMSDETLAYPLFEKCESLGIRTIAIHKSLPLGRAPMDPFRPSDVDYPALAFPQLNFEIVHGGFAFLEETCAQLARFPNVYVNLEVNTLLLMKQPRAFAQMLGEMLLWGGGKKILWGTGCMFVHPAPLLDAFERFEMPQDLMEEYGYPPVTDDVKRDILGGNYARLHGLELEPMRMAIARDDLSQRREAWQASSDSRPWSLLPGAEAAVTG